MKRFFLIVLALAGFAAARPSGAQQSRALPPEPGEYYSYFVVADVALGSREVPSLLGNLVLEKNGHYRFTQTDLRGTWRWEAKTGKVVFTGPLQNATPRYQAKSGFHTFVFSFKTGAGRSTDITSSRKASKPFPSLRVVNGGLTGRLTVEARYNVVGEVDVATGRLTGPSFNGRAPRRNAGGEFVFLNEKPNILAPSIVIAGPDGKTARLLKGEFENGSTMRSTQAVLSPDGAKLAFTGETIVSRNGAVLGEPCLHVVGRDGRKIAVLQDIDVEQAPSWTGDERLVLIAKDGGIELTSADFKTRTRLAAEAAQSPAVSPNNKRVAFLRGQSAWTMSLNGTGLKKVATADQPMGALAWSPSGRQLAVSVKRSSVFQIWIVPLLSSSGGGKPIVVTNQKGEETEVASAVLSWR